jgi:prepilin-type N-terminal cleavage/methylation domain-containing protein
MKTNSYNRGMTLVEIAIVLVIIGIVIGLGTALVGPLTKRMKINDTKEVVNAAVDAIISYAATNSRLPCAGNDNTGFCSSVGDEFTPAVRNPNDAWGKPLYYAYDNRLTTAGSVCGRRTTNYTICRDAACTAATNIQNVAFIVASGAENFNLQTGQAGPTGGCTTLFCVKVYDVDTAGIDDCTTALNCPNYPPALLINRPEAYDDIVKWVNLDELRTKIGCQGAPLQILNNELPSTSLGSSYTANVFATGGVPNLVGTQNQYRWCVEIRNRTVAQGPPNGVSFNPSFIRYPDSTQYCSDQAEGAWPAWANNLAITKTTGSTETGSFSITVFARDNSNTGIDTACNTTTNRDNCAQKSFVITISP